MLMFKESKDKQKIKNIVDGILSNKSLTKDEMCEIARKIILKSESNIKEVGFNISVRDFGDENTAIKNARIHKGYDSIEIDLRNSDKNDGSEGDNYITITPHKVAKNGRINDVRLIFRKDDNYYFDDPPNCDVIVVKHRSEPTDADIIAKKRDMMK
jgi:hypothetical protein